MAIEIEVLIDWTPNYP